MTKRETVPALGTTPLIRGFLSGLPDPDDLARKIHSCVEDYHRAEASLGSFGGATTQIGDLSELVAALKIAQRKMNAAPVALRALAGWPGTVSAFNAAVDPVLDLIPQIEATIAQHRAGRGNQGPSPNLDTLIAYVVGIVRDPKAHDHMARARKILEAYGINCPESVSAFRAAANRGAQHLKGPAPEGSVEWLQSRKKNN